MILFNKRSQYHMQWKTQLQMCIYVIFPQFNLKLVISYIKGEVGMTEDDGNCELRCCIITFFYNEIIQTLTFYVIENAMRDLF